MSETCKIFGQSIKKPGPRQAERIEYGIFSFELETTNGEDYMATVRYRGTNHIVTVSEYKKASEALREVEEKVTQILREMKDMSSRISPIGRLLSDVTK